MTETKKPTRAFALSDFTYAAPNTMIFWLITPIGVLQGVYAKYFGVSLTALASILLLARVFDAVSDVVVGYSSDYCRRKTGTRKPLILIGGLSFIISAYFLYVPFGVDPTGSDSISFAYIITWFLLFYLTFTLFEVSHTAWASELAPNTADKSRIFSIRSMSSYLGLTLFYLVPMLPFFETSDITPETLKWTVVAAGALLIPSLYICLKVTPNGPAIGNRYKIRNRSEQTLKSRIRKLYKAFHSIIRNAPLLQFFSCYFLLGTAAGLWFGAVFLYVDVYLGMGAQFAAMFLLTFLVTIFITPLWYKLSLLWGKKNVLLLAIALFCASYLFTGVLKPENVSLSALVFLKLLNSFGNSCLVAIAPAMLSEIVDYCNLKYRKENTGVYYSFYLFFNKSGAAIGGALGLAIVGWFGFDATTQYQSAQAVTGLMIAMVWLPSSLAALAILPLILNPITEERHKIIRQRLAQREARFRREQVMSNEA